MNGPQLGSELNKRSFALSSSHEAMNQIAESTGGKAYYNRNDIDHAVALSIADGSTYYTITYYPEDKDWNGKFRNVELKLSRSGIQARYRHGYYAIDPAMNAGLSTQVAQRQIGEALGDPIPSTMITLYGSAFKLAPANASPTTLTPESTHKTESNTNNEANNSLPSKLLTRQKIGVRFLVVPTSISMQKRGDVEHFSLDFAVAAFKGGKVVAQLSQSLEGNPKPDTLKQILQQGLLFNTAIDVPPGNCRLRLLVRDHANGRVGTVDIPITDATPVVKQ